MSEVAMTQTRPVRILAVGGTIAMSGDRAIPALDADALVGAVPQLADVAQLEAETLLELPGPHLSLRQSLEVATRARDAADRGEGVVVTTGTDTMEELAVVSAMTYGGDAPIVFTGANRPASNPGADGPANLFDAVSLAGSPAAAGLGTVVVFGGEIHAAMGVQKIDSTGPAAFGSPVAGPVGRIVEGRVWVHARPIRPTPLVVHRLEFRVPIVTATLGDEGDVLAELAASRDGIVLVALGAGHLSVSAIAELRTAVEQVPVVVTVRTARRSMLFDTYGFTGSERDIRQSGATCAPFLSPAAARIALLCCLGAELDRDGIASALARWDAA